MNFTTATPVPPPACTCGHGDLIAATYMLLLAATDGRPLPTDRIDQLPPWRARLVVSVLLRSGATLQHGTAEQFDTAVRAAGKADGHQTGWWREALGLPPREEPPAAPRTPGWGDPGYVPPAGWAVVGAGNGTS